MGMANGEGTGTTVSEINVTPLIDVLLVLLIIFMVIVPVVPKGLDAALPQPARNTAVTPPQTIVLSLVSTPGLDPVYRINQEVLPKTQIAARLQQIFAARQEKAMFVQADSSAEFSQVAEMIDLGHQAGVESIGLMTRGNRVGR